MKILNKVEVTLKNGKEEKRTPIREGVKVVDSVADNLVIDGEQEIKRQKNLTGIETITPQGDKVNKSKVLEVWEEAEKAFDIDKANKDALIEYAQANEIDLGEAKTKAEIIVKIKETKK